MTIPSALPTSISLPIKRPALLHYLSFDPYMTLYTLSILLKLNNIKNYGMFARLADYGMSLYLSRIAGLQFSALVTKLQISLAGNSEVY